MTTVLLTGASGFVGRQLLTILDQMEVNIVVVCRNHAQSAFENFSRIKKIVITEDLFIQSNKWYEGLCEGIDIIIHAAWYAEPGKYLNSSLNLECAAGTINFATSAINMKIKKFIGIGTCFEYDVKHGYLEITTPLLPVSDYAKAKVLAFQEISKIFALKGVSTKFAWCRLFYLYGEGEDERRLVSSVKKKLSLGEQIKLSDGLQIRDFIDVKEAAQQIITVAFSNLFGPQNICSGVGISVKDMVLSIARDYENVEDLLKFGEETPRPFDPPKVIGVKSF